MPFRISTCTWNVHSVSVFSSLENTWMSIKGESKCWFVCHPYSTDNEFTDQTQTRNPSRLPQMALWQFLQPLTLFADEVIRHKGLFTNTCKGGLMQTNFIAKIFRAPLFAMKITGQPYKDKAVLQPRVSPAFAITYLCNHCNIRFENTSKYVDTVTFFQKPEPKVIDPKMTFDPKSVEVKCVTLPKDHCVQVTQKYIKVCGYNDLVFKNLNQRSLTPRWPLTPCLLRSHVWLYPRIIVSKSHGSTSMYADTVINFAKYHIKHIRYKRDHIVSYWTQFRWDKSMLTQFLMENLWLIFFSGPHLQGSKILRAPLSASGPPPLQRFVDSPQSTLTRSTGMVYAFNTCLEPRSNWSK